MHRIHNNNAPPCWIGKQLERKWRRYLIRNVGNDEVEKRQRIRFEEVLVVKFEFRGVGSTCKTTNTIIIEIKKVHYMPGESNRLQAHVINSSWKVYQYCA